ncbi:MAG TPA: hypothetical protein VHW46_12845 [Terracidiphilus sp.]|nr:hypothetical protein [Terracidiphilus sp.]
MKASVRLPVLLSFALALMGCGGTSTPVPPGQVAHAPLSAGNINLIFVVSEDLTNKQSGDIDADTANLTSQGLQRTLLMGSYLQHSVLGNQNVTGIYALEPMTHPQTTNLYPDMVALETVQQLALLNVTTLDESPSGPALYTGNSFPINVGYAPGQVIPDVAAPLVACESCQGIDFTDQNGDNESLIHTVIDYGVSGYFVFSAPWETTQALLAAANTSHSYGLALPSTYQGPNFVYAISIDPSGGARLMTYDSNLQPASTYPALPPPALTSVPCALPAFNLSVPSSMPPVANTNETVYLMRHAEAHPTPGWEDGNYVAAGQWRALALPNALRGKINPDQIYSIDPAQTAPSGDAAWSYVRPSLTVEPYAIANNLPYHLVSDFELDDLSAVTADTIDFFFNDPQFSNHKILLAWEHEHFPPLVNELLKSYGSSATVPAWASADYDSIWTVKLDSAGNLTVDNLTCEGINSAALPATAPQF